MQAIVKSAIALGIAGAVGLGSMTLAQARVQRGDATGADPAAASVAATHVHRYGHGYGPGYEAFGYAPSGRYGESFQGFGYGELWHERQLEGRDY